MRKGMFRRSRTVLAGAAAAVSLATGVTAAMAGPAASATAAPASTPAVVFGIHDSAVNSCDDNQQATSADPTQQQLNEATSSFRDGLWDGLHTHEARFIVPWDIADPGLAHPQDQNALVAEQKCLGAWLNEAAAKGVTPEIAFQEQYGPSAHAGTTAHVPSIQNYEAAFDKFRAMFPSVTVFAPWNEPDHPQTASGTTTPDPSQAGQMWIAVYHRCSGCVVIAGDFGPGAGGNGYLNSYNDVIKGYHPSVWAVHPYGDVASYENGDNTPLPDTTVGRFATGLYQLGYRSDTHIWLDEVSVTTSGHSEAAQTAAARYLVNTLYQAGGRTTANQPIVTRLYYLRYAARSADPNGQEVALVKFSDYDSGGSISNGTPVGAYSVFSGRPAPWQ